MKCHEFIFKFVNTSAQRLTIICIKVHCNDKVVEWTYSDDPGKHVAWLVDHQTWEHNLKKLVCQKAKEVLAGIEGSEEAEIVTEIYESEQMEQSSHSHKFPGYTLKCVDVDKKAKMVNMNHGTSTDEIKFRKIFCDEKCCMKFTKGPHPKSFQEILDYPKTFVSQIYNATTKEDKTIDLGGPECVITLPMEEKEAKKSTMSKKSQEQTGGAYMNKYLKYKTKYFHLRNQLM